MLMQADINLPIFIWILLVKHVLNFLSWILFSADKARTLPLINANSERQL